MVTSKDSGEFLKKKAEKSFSIKIWKPFADTQIH